MSSLHLSFLHIELQDLQNFEAPARKLSRKVNVAPVTIAVFGLEP